MLFDPTVASPPTKKVGIVFFQLPNLAEPQPLVARKRPLRFGHYTEAVRQLEDKIRGDIFARLDSGHSPPDRVRLPWLDFLGLPIPSKDAD